MEPLFPPDDEFKAKTRELASELSKLRNTSDEEKIANLLERFGYIVMAASSRQLTQALKIAMGESK
jgi:hypothetical protein